MKTMRCLLLIALLPLAGCASSTKFKENLDSFVGRQEADLIGAWGPPQSSYSLLNGSRALQYSNAGQLVMPGATTYQPVVTNTAGNVTLSQGLRQTTGVYSQQSTTYVAQQSAPIAINLSCVVTFTVDSAGYVARWRADGNHCVAK